MVPEPSGKSSLHRLLTQLRQRKLVQWAIAYAAGAWLLLQVIDTVGPRWGFTEFMSRTLDVVLLVGFAVTLVLVWYHGEQGRQRVNGAELLILGALLFIGGVSLRMVEVEAPADAAIQVDSSATTTPAPASATAAEISASDDTRLRTIAVLPFDNYSPDPDDAYFAAGITEEITGQLARIGDLTVLSRVAVERAVETENSLEAIARSLGAGALLEGSVRMAGPRVRITAQLIEVESQQHLWSDNFDRELTDIFQIQTDVALAIGEALLAELPSGERRRIETPATVDIRAYQLYLRSRQLSGSDPEENRKAIERLEQALALDPSYAEARARLSWRHTWEARLTGQRTEAERAEQLAREVLAQDPDLGLGHYVLGSALGELERMEEVGAAFARAHQLDPNNVSILSDGSFYYATMGQPARGLSMAFHAVRLDPNSANRRWHAVVPLLFLGDRERTAAWLELARDEGMEHHRLASAQAELALANGTPDRAAAIARNMLERFPDAPEASLMAQQVLFLTGDWSEVAEELVAQGREAPGVWRLPHLAPRSQRALMGFVLAEQGEVDAARQAFDESLAAAEVAVANGSTYKGRALDAASIHAYRGDHEAALQALERAYDLGFRGDFVLAVDPFFAGLRDEPRFQELLRRMADSQREQREIARRTGALEDYDALIAAGPAGGV